MPLVNAKCTNCGANIKIDDNKEAAVCEFCGSAFIVEKAINNYNITNNINANVVNIYNQSSCNTNPDYIIESGKLLKYKGEEQEIVIPNEVHTIGKDAFKNTTIKKVIFHKGIVSIEKDSEDSPIKGAFSGCDNLTEVQLAGITEIPENAFEKCENLKTVVLQKGITIIGKNAFASCHNLISISLPNTLKRIEQWAFGWCYSLKEITIPASVQYVACQSFESCKNLETVNIEDGVQTIHSGAFVGCDSITVLRYPQSVYIDNISLLRAMKCKIAAENPELSNRINALNNKSGGCYIATAIYGSYDCPQVWTLRRYRDNVLSKKWYGRLFIHFYYFFSPTFVDWFGKDKWFSSLWKPILDNKVKYLKDNGFSDKPYFDP